MSEVSALVDTLAAMEPPVPPTVESVERFAAERDQLIGRLARLRPRLDDHARQKLTLALRRGDELLQQLEREHVNIEGQLDAARVARHKLDGWPIGDDRLGHRLADWV